MKALTIKKFSFYALIICFMLCLFASSSLAVTTPAQVTSLKAKASGISSVYLSWDELKSCDAYAIFLYTPSNKEYTFIKNTKNNEYKITDLNEGETYYFAVQAYNKDGNKKLYGDISDYVKVTTKVNEPSKVKGLDTSAVYSTKLKLTWDEVSGVKYAVYFYDAETKKYTHISNTSKPTLTVSGLDPEATYRFAVRAYRKVAGKTYYSEYSSKLKVTTNPMPLEDEDVRKIFNSAMEIYMNWVYSCAYTNSDKYITRDFYGLPCKFALVEHKSINSLSDLENMLSNYFTKEIYENELYLYTEYGGKLYYYAEGTSGTPDKGTKYYTDSLKKITYKKYRYTIYPVYYESYDSKYSPDDYCFTLIRQNGKWLFDGKFYPCSAKIKD